jgi:hypothetical protein
MHEDRPEERVEKPTAVRWSPTLAPTTGGMMLGVQGAM